MEVTTEARTEKTSQMDTTLVKEKHLELQKALKNLMAEDPMECHWELQKVLKNLMAENPMECHLELQKALKNLMAENPKEHYWENWMVKMILTEKDWEGGSSFYFANMLEKPLQIPFSAPHRHIHIQ
jgi:hypothetical protein